MKLNWGTSIVLAFVAFIVFILYFVVKTFTQPAYDYDLVSESYYKEELEFQNTINDSKKANALVDKVIFNRVNNVLNVFIPNPNNELIYGSISFYRPSNDQLDFSVKINGSDSNFSFDENRLVKGRWDIKIRWSYQSNPSETYYKKESIYY